jgi:hypothetical protein
MLQLPQIEPKVFEVFSSDGKNKTDIKNGVYTLYYYESILENSVIVSFNIIDTGFRLGEGRSTEITEYGKTDLQFGEKVYLNLEDNDGNKLLFDTDATQLRFAQKPSKFRTNQLAIMGGNLVSYETIIEKNLNQRVSSFYEGKISDTVKSIFLNHLKTKKTLDIDPTINTLKVEGSIDNTGCPFYRLNWLSKMAVPDIKSSLGNTAGYFFYETADGYKFKSIDVLLSQTPKKKLIMNNSTKLPPGYDGKILSSSSPSGLPYIDHKTVGTYASQRITFNPYNNKYENSTISSTDQDKSAVRAGDTTPKIPEELQGPSRVTTLIEDIGNNIPGNNSDQIRNSKTANFNVKEIVNQSFMRYNQLFAIQMSITIFADLSLHAGDLIECYFPEVSSNTTKLVSSKESGKYLICDLCHYVSPEGPNYTKLNLVRDSYGIA